MQATVFCDDFVFVQDFANVYHLVALPLVINRPSELVEVQWADVVPEYLFPLQTSDNIPSNPTTQHNNFPSDSGFGLIVD